MGKVAYQVKTERLLLRCYEPEDAPLLKAAVDSSLDHLRPWMPWAANEPEEVEKKIRRLRHFRAHFDLGKDFIYGVFAPDGSELWGSTGLQPRAGDSSLEIGYWIRVEQIGKGFATELTKALTRVAFEVNGVRRVDIQCDPANVKSANIPHKLGFTHEGTLRARVRMPNGERRGSMMWTMLQDEYAESGVKTAVVEAYDLFGVRVL